MADDEESRGALKTLRARFLAALGMTASMKLSHRLSGVLFFPISLSPCACPGGESNSPSLRKGGVSAPPLLAIPTPPVPSPGRRGGWVRALAAGLKPRPPKIDSLGKRQLIRQPIGHQIRPVTDGRVWRPTDGLIACPALRDQPRENALRLARTDLAAPSPARKDADPPLTMAGGPR